MSNIAYFMKKFNDQIDDVRVLDNEVIASSAYNYALTATQAKDVMNNGAVNFGPSTGSP